MDRPEKAKEKSFALFVWASIDVLSLSYPEYRSSESIQNGWKDHQANANLLFKQKGLQLCLVFLSSCISMSIMPILISPSGQNWAEDESKVAKTA